MEQYTNITELIGKEWTKVVVNEYNDILTFENDQEVLTFFHCEDCCETVMIDQIDGNLSDLEGSCILRAEEWTKDDPEAYGVGQWTFYRFATIKGYVTIRWYGESNGYYSVAVDYSHKYKTLTP